MNELDKLRYMLDEAEIPYESFREIYADTGKIPEFMDYRKSHYGEAGIYSRNQVCYYGAKKDEERGWKIDGICQFGSYGAEDGLIETYGDLGVDSDGEPRIMTANQMFEIIKNDWEQEVKSQ